MEDHKAMERIAKIGQAMRAAFGERAESVAVRMASEAAPHSILIAEIWLQVAAAIRDADAR